MTQKTFSELFSEKSTGVNVFIFFILYALMQASMIIIVMPLLQFYTPEMPMDGRFIYTAGDVHEYLTNLTVHGRNLYTVLGLYDIVFPVIYGIFFALLISWLFLKASLEKSFIFRLRFVPFLAAGLDIAENISFYFMTKSYPSSLPTLVAAANAATLGKWISVPVTFLLIITAVLILGFKKAGSGKLAASN